MRVGINLFATTEYEPDDLYTRYLYKCLSQSSQLQETTKFVIFQNRETMYEKWAGWQVITDTEKYEGFLSSFTLRSSPLDPLIRKHKVDAVITPLETAHFITSSPCIPLIIHTENWYRGILKEDFFRKRDVKRIFQESPLWITASEYTRRSCLDVWKVPLNKIIVLPAGVEPSLAQTSPSLISPPYFVSVIDDATIHHLPEILEIITYFCKENPHTIVLLGKKHPKEPANWGDNVFRIEECPDRTLAGLLQNATAFIYPGIHDGSALRPIEAMQAGTCVVTPLTPAMEERCGELPFYYHAENPSSINAVLNRIMNLSDKEKQERIRLGRLRVVEYTWEQSTWKLITALKRI